MREQLLPNSFHGVAIALAETVVQTIAERVPADSFRRPSGTRSFFRAYPALKRRAIVRSRSATRGMVCHAVVDSHALVNSYVLVN